MQPTSVNAKMDSENRVIYVCNVQLGVINVMEIIPA